MAQIIPVPSLSNGSYKCILADGSQLVAGVGNRVLVYDAVDGDLLHALKGHKVTRKCLV